MTNIGAQMRDNPLPLLLIGTGLGLMISRSFRHDGYYGGYGLYRDDTEGDLIRRVADPTAGFGYDADEYRTRRSSSARGPISEQAAALRDNVAESMSSASEMFVEGVSDLSDRASDVSQRARSGLSMLASEQPLVLGALGLLAGAALAAMLPRTQMEDEYMGDAARRLRDEARSSASDTIERAKHAASKAADVASREFSAEPESHASGGPSPTQGSHATPGASALGVSSGSGGARPSETISAGMGHRDTSRSGA